ncbi:RecQ2 [Desulforapulum autotrophicum HRM2]|uniref:RecQ2 n=1 Tax=Desulforapulum autotrophicum (strain ATCC 43914 / DSM 3382 / VKM B-1955 / HRM2) TaxID=177437 RepID=C0QD57_DESAH|nr:RecQ2 [Desulforapulum autotrophicum HRM2]
MIRFFSSLIKRLFRQEPPKPTEPVIRKKQPPGDDTSIPTRKKTETSQPQSPETRHSPPIETGPGEKVRPGDGVRPHKKREPWTLDHFQVPTQEGKTRFHDLDLPLGLMHAISDENFQYCMPVQAEVLPHTLMGKDATAKAQTGTGKSAAFLVTIIARLMKNPTRGKREKGTPRALIIEPTRELVLQIEKDAKALTLYTPLRTVSVFGGMDYKRQQDQLASAHVDIIAATPGRLMDFMRQKLINLGKIEILVIDEADRLLDMGFIPDMRNIIYNTPHKKERQTLFFSATLAPEILRMANQWTVDPAVVEIDPDKTAADSINQKVFIVTEDQKFPLLYNLISGEKLERVILFVNMRSTTRRIAQRLVQFDISSEILSGEVSQKQRIRTLDDFRNGKVRVLVATDVAARGLHIEGVSHVINYDLPQDPEHYIHRIGRTGRAGAEGISVSFADEMSSFQIPDIEAVLGNKLECEYPDDAMLAPLPKPKRRIPPKPDTRPPQKKNRSSRSNSRPRSKGTPGPKGSSRQRNPRNAPKKESSQR